MRIIMGGMSQPTLDGSTVRIRQAMSDPVPTCSLNLIDNTSSIVPVAMQELLVIDDQVYPNPTINYFLNPSLNPYNGGGWLITMTGTGRSYATVVGGGVAVTYTNYGGFPTDIFLTSTAPPIGQIVVGQSYTASIYVQGSSSPTNLKASIQLIWQDGTGNTTGSQTFTGPTPVSTSLVRYSVQGVAPAGTMTAQMTLSVIQTNNTNSGVVTFTQAQFEPDWIPTLAYPTPFCGPSQTNCQQLPLGYWIRQYRKFAGFVTHSTNGSYHGNVRTVSVDAVGYAWLMGTIVVNNTFASQTDAQIISTLLSTYLTSNYYVSPTALVTTTYVVTGASITTYDSNWDDLRTLFDGLASQSGFYWTVDNYWNMIYAPPGYFAASIALICDDSSTPNMTTTFPGYEFSSEMDYTQPGSTVLVLGNGTNSAKVIDGNTTRINGINSGYYLPTGSSYMRKVNEGTLGSNADCVIRGIADMLQYDSPRGLYHVRTNVELIAGESIQITSATEGLTASSQLIQTVQSSWMGTSETLQDYWEYQSDLGAVNRATVNILSRLFRLTNSNSTAVAIGTTSLAVFENLGLNDVPTAGTISTQYQAVVLADHPLGYFRLNELLGSTCDDISGNAYAGIYHGGFTLAQVGLLTTIPGNSTLFDGSTGYVSNSVIPVPTGAHVWSLEGWCRVSALPAATYCALLGWGNRSAQQMGVLFLHNAAGTHQFVLSTFAGDITGTTVVAINTDYYVVGTYDGASTRLYVNGSLEAGPTAFTMNMTATFASIGADGSSPTDWFSGYLQDCAFYNTLLSPTQIAAHYAAR